MDDLMMAHPEVDYVMGINDVMTLGAMAAVEGAGKSEQIKAVMICGGQKEAFSRLKAGDPCLKGAALLYPYQIGTQAIEAAVRILQGKPVAPEILAPVKLITHENAVELEQNGMGKITADRHRSNIYARSERRRTQPDTLHGRTHQQQTKHETTI